MTSRWIGVLAIEGEETSDGRLLRPGAVAMPDRKAGRAPRLWPLSTNLPDWPAPPAFGPILDWCRRGNLIVARGEGGVRHWTEAGADLGYIDCDFRDRDEMPGDPLFVFSTATIAGAHVYLDGQRSAWPGRCFVAPELPSTCVEHGERRLECAACYPLPAAVPATA